MKGSSLGSRACILLTLGEGEGKKVPGRPEGLQAPNIPKPYSAILLGLKVFPISKNKLLKPKCS